jgi:hypothetical protein
MVHDEFSYLLAADTFLHGRLTNPTPPGWQSFETFHELMRPTYMSKYPPGQGLLLAAGRLIGLPHDGTFFVIALASAAICWMAAAALRPKWALYAGLLAAWAPINIVWGSDYWGGGGAMLGGALLGGAVLRLMRPGHFRRPIVLGIAAAIGLGMLANTRPFEGFILAILLAGAMGIAAFRRRLAMRPLLTAVAGAMPLMIGVLVWMGYYNWRVTGHALEMPYMEHARQYMMAPLFRFQSPRTNVQYQSPRLRQMHAVHEFEEYQREQTWPGLVAASLDKIHETNDTWVRPQPMAIPLIAALIIFVVGRRSWRRRSWQLGYLAKILTLPLAIVLLFPLVHQTLTHFLREQYLAPGAGFFFMLVAEGTCAIATLSRGKTGWVATLGGAFAPALLAALLFAAVVTGLPDRTSYNAQVRVAIIQQISAQPGNHIVFVDYRPDFEVGDELVWNNADIATQKVIFARWIDRATAVELMRLYPGRTPWHLVVDTDLLHKPVYHVGLGI